MEETQKSLVAFIDILGFKEMVEEYYNGNNKTILQILKDTLHKAEEEINNFDLDITPAEPSYKQFSDSISLSLSIISDDFLPVQSIGFILLLGSYQRILMENKIFCRGGIAYGDHYEDSNFIFSKSLIKAYGNETEIAIYPRIVIDKELVEKMANQWKSLKLQVQEDHFLSLFKIFNDPLDSLIIKDWDDIYFINPFDYFFHMKIAPNNDGLSDELIEARRQYIERHNKIYKKILENVESNIERYTDDYTILKKYLWLREFLVWHNDPTKSRIVFERMK